MAMLAHTLSLSKGATGTEKGFREPSFSTYLNGAEQSFVLNLVNHCKVDEDDGEIGVFSADKYFNEGLDEKARACEKPVTPMVLSYADKPVKSTIQYDSESRAVSVRSGSSGNSQSTLLQRSGMNQSDSKMQGRGGYLGSFRCKCVCSDKNSVAVEEYKSWGDSPTISQQAAKEPMQKGICPRKKSLISPRKSIDVFGLQGLERRDKTFCFETEEKLRLKWEYELHKTAETVIPFPTIARGIIYAESDSDVSSDLFELEDFSTPNVNPFLSRQVSRNMSGSATPIAGYAPTEASIAWSVVTASAADFPITSDYQELHSGSNTTNSKTGSTTTNKKVTATDDKPKRLSSSFLACNSQNSVTVVHQTHKTYEKISHQKITKARI